jgi:hypothetical protein
VTTITVPARDQLTLRKEMLHRENGPSLSLADIERIAGDRWAGKR